MLKVIKRSGREEVFNIEKIKHSAAAASDELRQPLGSSDINNLAADVQTQLEGREKITSKELYDLVVSIMCRNGFSDLADAYMESGSNFWAVR